MKKPFKGIISNWNMLEGRINGTCEYHTTYENGIVQGLNMTTSEVLSIVPLSMRATAALCETHNSFYVLV